MNNLNNEKPSSFICDFDVIDITNNITYEIINGLMCLGHHIIFLSSRKCTYSEQTESFINKHFQKSTYTLYMREKDNEDKEYIYKSNFVDIISKEWSILVCITNLNKIWNDLGVSCLNIQKILIND